MAKVVSKSLDRTRRIVATLRKDLERRGVLGPSYVGMYHLSSHSNACAKGSALWQRVKGKVEQVFSCSHVSVELMACPTVAGPAGENDSAAANRSRWGVLTSQEPGPQRLRKETLSAYGAYVAARKIWPEPSHGIGTALKPDRLLRLVVGH